MNMNVIITRHPALVEFLHNRFPQLQGCEVISHATEEAVKGRHVWGVLPLHLAKHAESLTVVTLNPPLEKRGQELTIDDVKQFFGGVERYIVKAIPIE